eukprot:10949732-Alexandrium_andersonii.AAC.1
MRARALSSHRVAHGGGARRCGRSRRRRASCVRWRSPALGPRPVLERASLAARARAGMAAPGSREG